MAETQEQQTEERGARDTSEDRILGDLGRDPEPAGAGAAQASEEGGETETEAGDDIGDVRVPEYIQTTRTPGRAVQPQADDEEQARIKAEDEELAQKGQVALNVLVPLDETYGEEERRRVEEARAAVLDYFKLAREIGMRRFVDRRAREAVDAYTQAVEQDARVRRIGADMREETLRRVPVLQALVGTEYEAPGGPIERDADMVFARHGFNNPADFDGITGDEFRTVILDLCATLGQNYGDIARRVASGELKPRPREGGGTRVATRETGATPTRTAGFSERGSVRPSGTRRQSEFEQETGELLDSLKEDRPLPQTGEVE